MLITRRWYWPYVLGIELTLAGTCLSVQGLPKGSYIVSFWLCYDFGGFALRRPGLRVWELLQFDFRV